MGGRMGAKTSPGSASVMCVSCIGSFGILTSPSKEEVRKLSLGEDTFLKITQNLDLNRDLSNSKICALEVGCFLPLLCACILKASGTSVVR